MFEDLQSVERAEIVDVWIREALTMYPVDAAAFYENGKDPFANPVGASVRDALGPLFDLFASEAPLQDYTPHLDRVIRVRCVQDVPASHAVGFVFLLKGVIRKVLASQLTDAQALTKLMVLDARIDKMAACAFDVYTAHQRKIADIRVREMKASVAMLERMSKIASGGTDDEADEGQGPCCVPVRLEEEAGDR